MKTSNISTIVAFAIISVVLSGCLKNKVIQDKPISKDDIFKFEVARLCEVNLDFDLSNYSIIAELYSINPLDDNGSKKVDINPIYRGITDKKGVINDIMELSKNIETVYFYTEYLGLQNMIPIAVKGNNINFSVKTATDALLSRSTAPSTRGTVPANVIKIGEWGPTGIPDYLSPRINLPEGLYYDIMKTLPNSGEKGPSKAADFLGKGAKTVLDIKTNTPIDLVFITEAASMKNSICYYHYPTGQEPKNIKDIELIMVYPNITITEYNIDGTLKKGLSSGDNVRLKYKNPVTGALEETFPAGTTLALAIIANSFKDNGNIENKQNTYYANSYLNTSEAEENSEHIILLHKNGSDDFVFFLEDKPRTGNVTADGFPGGNFHDAILYISSGVDGAIDNGTIPELPDTNSPGPIESTMTCEGTLLFEDLWPSEGDYDMNDIVIEYISTVHRGNNNNMVLRIDDEFKVTNQGGKKMCGFGYQFNVYESAIQSVSYAPIPEDISTNAKGLEVGQNYSTPTVMLFNNILSQPAGTKFKVTTIFASPVKIENVMPPYNPFITINGRDKELHLTEHTPTSLANKSYFNTYFDVSDPDNGIYYVSKNNSYPFAMKLPIRGFVPPTESVRIDVTYPGFSEWVKSNGEKNKDWYL